MTGVAAAGGKMNAGAAVTHFRGSGCSKEEHGEKKSDGLI